MQNFEDYTPEMLSFYHALPEPIRNSVRYSDLEIEDLDGLVTYAENLAKLWEGR